MTSPLGLESGVVRLVAYDASWPELFENERRRLLAALGPLPAAFEHMGSTSVPGLAAKPILDLMVGVPATGVVAAYVAPIVQAGYVHRGEQGIPGREFFRRGEPRMFHIHLARVGGTFWVEQLAFRDYLRAHPDVRDEYAALKYALAARFPTDRPAYIDGKTAFVRRVVALAIGGRP